MLAGTVVLRVCIFPLVIVAQRNAAQMHNHMPTIQRLQDKFTKTRATGNVLEGQWCKQGHFRVSARNRLSRCKAGLDGFTVR